MKGGPINLPRAVMAGLAAAVVLDTTAQVAWKLAVSAVPRRASLAAAAAQGASSPSFFAAMAALGAQLYNWIRVLARADLSFAQPITALGYVTVLAISGRWLHEPMPAPKLIGVGLILAGVFCISRTPLRTTRPASGRRTHALDSVSP